MIRYFILAARPKGCLPEAIALAAKGGSGMQLTSPSSAVRAGERRTAGAAVDLAAVAVGAEVADVAAARAWVSSITGSRQAFAPKGWTKVTRKTTL